VDVQVYTHSELPALLSPAELRSYLLAASLRGVSVKRARVAKQPALLASDVQEVTRDDGTQTQVSGTLYFFRAPKGIIHVEFIRSDPSDREFDQMTRTMINSVRPLR
jgi:hypothetical protein